MKIIDLHKLKFNWLLICIFISNVSQTPQLIEVSYFRLINVICWLILFIMNLPAMIRGSFLQNKIIQKMSLFLYFYLMFLLICQIVSGEGYLLSFNIYPLILAIFIFLNVFLVINPHDGQGLKKILLTYVISALITILNVYFLYYLKITANMLSWQYAYDEKNTIAVINLFVISSLMVMRFDSLFMKIGKYVIILFLIYLLFILKSRTAIIGGVFAILCHIIFSKSSVKNKILLFSFILFVSIIILSNDTIYSLLINKLFLNGKVNNGSVDLSMATSSRFDSIPALMSNFQTDLLFGIGYIRLESGILYSLISFGIIGAIPYITLATLPFFYSIKRVNFTKNFNHISFLLLYISAVSIINFLLEQRAPFGPGTKFSFLWLIFGIYSKYYGENIVKNHRTE